MKIFPTRKEKNALLEKQIELLKKQKEESEKTARLQQEAGKLKKEILALKTRETISNPVIKAIFAPILAIISFVKNHVSINEKALKKTQNPFKGLNFKAIEKSNKRKFRF